MFKNRPFLIALTTLVLSLVAGVVNGLLGTGGGIIILFTLFLIDKTAVKENFASASGVVIIMSVVSAVLYYLRGNIDLREFNIYIIPAILGGLCGAVVLYKMKSKFLNKIFAVFVIYAGVSMIFKS